MPKIIANLTIICLSYSLVSCQIKERSPQTKELNIETNIPAIEKSEPLPKPVINNPPEKAIPKEIVEGVPILMYHSIADDPNNDLMVSPSTFAAQMKHLKDAGYQTITFQDLEDWERGEPIPKKPVLLTFDDGYLDNYTAAYPVLKKYNLKATFFISINYLGDARHFSWENIKEMYDSGLIQFGSHSLSHPDLTVISAAKRREEIVKSKKIIEEKIGGEVIAFSYPAGAYNNIVIGETAEAGYKFAVTTRPGDARIEQGLLTLHRVRIHGYYTAADFVELFP
jgi:peptidoglycan/xylan/chitin deacetylase (PgdA/CDA1 family)